MGFMYQGRKLCCDLCGVAGATKVHCPYGCCNATAACPTCKRTRKDRLSRAAHADCAILAAKWDAEESARATLLAEGHWLRRAACDADGATKVWFGNRADEVMAVSMPADVYRAIPITVVTTLADYERIAGQAFDRVAA